MTPHLLKRKQTNTVRLRISVQVQCKTSPSVT